MEDKHQSQLKQSTQQDNLLENVQLNLKKSESKSILKITAVKELETFRFGLESTVEIKEKENTEITSNLTIIKQELSVY